MTVKELKNILSEFVDNENVYMSTSQSNTYYSTKIKIKKIEGSVLEDKTDEVIYDPIIITV